jgi:hypothetical protein
MLRHDGRVGCLTWATDLQSPATLIWAECLEALDAAEADPTAEIRHEPVDTPSKME